MSAYREKAIHAWTPESVRLAATPSSFAKSALFYIQEIGHFQAFSPYYTEREQLESFLLVYTLAGAGRLTYRDVTYELRPHQLFFIDCMSYQHYAADAAAGGNWELLWVHLSGSTTREYYEQFAAGCPPVLTLQPDCRIQACLMQLLQINRQKSTRTELTSSVLLAELLTEVLLAAQEPELLSVELPPYISAIIGELEQHYAQKMTLDQLARRHAVSKYHLAKQFKRYTGFSPHEYVIGIRISQAKELLKYSNQPVAEIALMVGIDNVSHFINLFKAREGVTPLVYRKQWQPSSIR
ncbi:AraC-type DNA-binding protein [Paenibacillus algorifonticola]|uniref:AraC-type DNA-binding protein n=1 Tax=Paenibacillus algorifonticola TaxID=684063 RepID=A0A1I2EYN5_9BACL|nr:AraC family transcriptional regulator [Paenibacillus algorifonticola]SFE98192.1 AraC-type DNA-binding protein [Paenibacillus algorifonticola]